MMLESIRVRARRLATDHPGDYQYWYNLAKAMYLRGYLYDLRHLSGSKVLCPLCGGELLYKWQGREVSFRCTGICRTAHTECSKLR